MATATGICHRFVLNVFVTVSKISVKAFEKSAANICCYASEKSSWILECVVIKCILCERNKKKKRFTVWSTWTSVSLTV